LYCDSAQLKVLLTAAAWKEGKELTCTVGAKGACVYAIVPVMEHGGYQATVPCGGDRRYAMCESDEMIFSLPRVKFEELMTALRSLDEHGLRLPLDHVMMPEFEFHESYMKVGRMMGMDIDKGRRRISLRYRSHF